MITFLVCLFFTLFSPPMFSGDKNITILYNNVSHDPEMKCGWGFSCLVKGMQKTILFDAGGNGKVLQYNMEKRKLDPEEIDVVVLSHIHGDHTEGLWSILEGNRPLTVYTLQSFPQSFQSRIRDLGHKAIAVDEPVKICDGVWSTGQTGNGIKEQALVVETDEGLVIITGCAHPGIVRICYEAKKIRPKKIYMLLGGFHLISMSERNIERIIQQLRDLGVQKIAPSHCTGEKAMDLFRKSWGEAFVDAGCGAVIPLP